MKLIIAGSRHLKIWHQSIAEFIALGFGEGNKLEIISGGADGIDTSGEEFAHEFYFPIKRFLPDWETHGKAAGPMRNRLMAEHADALLLIWDGESRGSKSMRDEMMKLDKPVYEVILRAHNIYRDEK